MSSTDYTAILTPTSLRESDFAAFAKLGIPLSLLLRAGVERVTDAVARSVFGIVGPASRNMAGVVFPYYSRVTGRRVTARVRRDNPEIEDGKPKNRYISAWGDGRHLYFPPGAAENLKGPDTIIVLVESEKGALALTSWAERNGVKLVALALGGCWGWRGVVGKTIGSDGSRADVTGPLPDLDVCNGRKVFVCLDANVATNPKVRQAEKALVTLLAERGCEVRICRVPHLDNVNGPDDLIALHGDEAMRLSLIHI